MRWQYQQSVLHILGKRIQDRIRSTFDFAHAFHGRVNEQRSLIIDTELAQLVKQTFLGMYHNE
jgi:hypothetical protein